MKTFLTFCLSLAASVLGLSAAIPNAPLATTPGGLIVSPTNFIAANAISFSVDTMLDLIATPVRSNTVCLVRGYWSIGDGGGGPFMGDVANSAVTNRGTVIKPTGAGLTERWMRLVSGPVMPQMFGAMANGIDDDTQGSQDALDTLLPVYFPQSTSAYSITNTLHGHDNQQIYGDGIGKTVISYASSNMNCLQFVGKTNASVSGISFEASGIDVFGTAETNNNCLLLTYCNGITVSDCAFKNNRMGGVTLMNSDDCRIVGNKVLEGCGIPTILTNQWQAAGVLLYDSSRNTISQNLIKASLAYAIAGFTYSPTGGVNDNVISENQISGAHGYGIILYRAVVGGEIIRNKIVNNVIEDIDGNFTNPNFPATYAYGIGIYLQSSDDATVKGNTIRRIGLYTRDPTLTPAAIGLNGIRGAVISGNDISECYQDAIYWKDYGNSAGTNNMVSITGNTIYNIKRLTVDATGDAGDTNITVVSTNGWMVNDYITIPGGGSGGTNALSTYVLGVGATSLSLSNALVSPVTNAESFLVTSITKAAILGSAITNAVAVISGNAITEADDYAIVLGGGLSVQITGNTFLRNYDDINFNNCRTVSIIGNTFTRTKYLSLNSRGSVDACIIRDNIFDGCTIGASLPSDGIIAKENFFLDCGLGIEGGSTNQLVIGPNQFSGCGSSFPVGSFILEDVPNPSVKNATLVLCTNTVAPIITNLVDGVQGQIVTLIAYTPITIYGGTNFFLYNGDFVSVSGETISFVYNPFGATWLELSRARLTELYFGTGPWDQRPRISGATNNITISAYAGYDGDINLAPSGTGTVNAPSLNVTNATTTGRLKSGQSLFLERSVTNYPEADFRINSLTATNSGLWFGYYVPNNTGLIGAVTDGSAHRNLMLAPEGGSVGVGYLCYDTITNTFNVNGGISALSYTKATTNTVPGDAVNVKRYIDITVEGNTYKIPLYQ